MILKTRKIPKIGDIKIEKHFAIFPTKIFIDDTEILIFFHRYYKIYRYTKILLRSEKYWKFEKYAFNMEKEVK